MQVPGFHFLDARAPASAYIQSWSGNESLKTHSLELAASSSLFRSESFPLKFSGVSRRKQEQEKQPHNWLWKLQRYDAITTETDVQRLPEVEEVGREDLSAVVAEAPRITAHRVQSLKELEREQLWWLPRSDPEVDLAPLTDLLCPFSQVEEDDEVWDPAALLRGIANQLNEELDRPPRHPPIRNTVQKLSQPSVLGTAASAAGNILVGAINITNPEEISTPSAPTVASTQFSLLPPLPPLPTLSLLPPLPPLPSLPLYSVQAQPQEQSPLAPFVPLSPFPPLAPLEPLLDFQLKSKTSARASESGTQAGTLLTSLEPPVQSEKQARTLLESLEPHIEDPELQSTTQSQYTPKSATQRVARHAPFEPTVDPKPHPTTPKRESQSETPANGRLSMSLPNLKLQPSSHDPSSNAVKGTSGVSVSGYSEVRTTSISACASPTGCTSTATVMPHSRLKSSPSQGSTMRMSERASSQGDPLSPHFVDASLEFVARTGLDFSGLVLPHVPEQAVEEASGHLLDLLQSL